MGNLLASERAIKAASVNGTDIYRVDAGKFKTTSINFFFIGPLNASTATMNALLPAVLRRGSEKFNTLKDISLQLEKLYGTSFDCGVTKKGEMHIIQFYTEFLSPMYVPGQDDMFSKAFELLSDVIFDPYFENGCFKKEYVDQEKEKLLMLIEGRVNDKMQYSVERCLEEVCKDEPYGIYDYGSVDDLDKITAEDLTKHYFNVLETYQLQVYLAGNIDDKQIDTVAGKLADIKRGKTIEINSGFRFDDPKEVRYVNETMDVTQGKLCLGFRTNISPDSSEYGALMVYNGVLGGGVNSKLFQNVREKASLAYFAYSRLEKFKGLMVISSGIEFRNRDKAQEIILKQLEDIKNGNITEQELEYTVKHMITGVQSLSDSQMNIVDFYLSQKLSGSDNTFEDIINRIKTVTIADIVNAASKVVLDTVYFLTAPDNASGK
jgi:predicted Zn-dependent peptidase